MSSAQGPVQIVKADAGDDAAHQHQERAGVEAAGEEGRERGGEQAADHQSGGIGYGDFKKRLADAYWDHFTPMRARRDELAADPGYVDEVLRKGAERAREEAAKTLSRIRKAVGLL